MSVRGFQMALVCQRVVSQLRNSLRNGALAAKSGSFYALDFAAISQLRNGVTVLRNGIRVPRGGFAAMKIFAEGGMGLRNHFAAQWSFRSDFLGLRNNFAAKWRFRRGLFLAAKFRRPLNFHAFELLLIPNFLLSLLLTFLLILIIQKPILHQNKLELMH